jgi:hypothetical protein
MSKVEKALKSIEQVDTSLIGVARQRLDTAWGVLRNLPKG